MINGIIILISELKDWIKENRLVVVCGLLLFIIATLSFGLGYLTNREFSRVPIIIEKCSGGD